MRITTFHAAFAVCAEMLTSSAFAGPGPGSGWPKGFPTHVKTKAEAMECCLPKEKVALACKDCKTVSEKPGEEKKGVAAWFKPDSMHDCSGCKGKVTYKEHGAGKGTGQPVYKHVCSKCGPDSAFTCATHKKS
jgi:hypothetical protein